MAMNWLKQITYCLVFSSLLMPSKSYSQSASFQVNNYFTSPEAEQAMQKACEIWGNILVSNTTIHVNFYWVDASPFGFLGLTLSNGIKNFQNAPISNVWYPTSLAKAIAGNDLGITDVDIDMYIDSTRNWYLGTDGNCPAGQFHLVKVLLHEIGHGIGFYSVANLDANGIGSFSTVINPVVSALASFPVPALNGEPLIYDLFVENLQGEQLVDTLLFLNPSSALTAQFTGNNLYFNGVNTLNANNQSRPRLYAPNTFAFGSSILHLNENSFSPNSADGLMTPFSSAGETNLTPGPITLGILQDLGWTINPVSIQNSHLESQVLAQNYPNPFKKETTISFFLNSSSPITLKIYDAVGRCVRTLINHKMSAGLHQITWNGKDDFGKNLPQNMYIYQLCTPHQKLSRKLMLSN